MNTYHIQDARKLEEVVQEPVDLIITSPPYFDMKDYGPKNQIGFGQEYDAYLSDMRKVLEQCHAVANESASMWLVVDTLKKDKQFKLLPFDLVEEAEKVGWRLQDIIIWKKDKTLPFSRRGEMRSIFEYVLFFVKSDNFKYYHDRITDYELKEWWVKYPERYSPKGKAKSDVWEHPIPVQGSWGNQYLRHFCPLPSKMIDEIIRLCTDPGDIVFDPFAGSGAVLAEAFKLGRSYVGCDLNPEFKVMFENYLSTLSANQTDILLENNRKLFASTIWKLRALKWPSALLKVIRREDNANFELIQGVRINTDQEITNKSVRYEFILEKPCAELEVMITSLASKPPFSKYGFKTSVNFTYKLSEITDKWEYDWISTHNTPIEYKGDKRPFISSDISLVADERSMVDTFLKTGKINF